MLDLGLSFCSMRVEHILLAGLFGSLIVLQRLLLMFIVAMFIVGSSIHLQASNGEEIFVMSDLESLVIFFGCCIQKEVGLAIKVR